MLLQLKQFKQGFLKNDIKNNKYIQQQQAEPYVYFTVHKDSYDLTPLTKDFPSLSPHITTTKTHTLAMFITCIPVVLAHRFPLDTENGR